MLHAQNKAKIKNYHWLYYDFRFASQETTNQMGRWYPNTSTSSIQNFFMSSRKMFVTTKRLRSWEKHSDLNRLSYESCNLFWSRMHQDIFQLINIHLRSHTLTLIDTNVLVRWCTRHHFIENEKAPHTYLLIEFFLLFQERFTCRTITCSVRLSINE